MSRHSGLPVPRAVLVAAALLASSAAAATQPAAPRIVAIGDIHGSADGLTAILQAANLIDAKGHWSGGSAHLVQTGDYTDRGAQVRQVLDTLMRLEEEAPEAGGRADILLGNHEVMNLLLDLRDVSPEAYSAFADAGSEERRKRAYRDYASVMTRADRAALSEEEWNSAHPHGFVEYVDALAPRGRYGRWLRERKVVVESNGTIFMHAGLADPEAGDLDDVNRTVQRDIAGWDRTREILVREELITPYFTLRETLDAVGTEIKRISAALEASQPLGNHVTREFVQELQAAAQIGKSSLLTENGPMWFRGFATWPETEAGKITALLEHHGARRFVTGHTPVVNQITPRFENRVFLIDTGMLSSRFKGGRPSALEISGDTITAIYVNERDVLVK